MTGTQKNEATQLCRKQCNVINVTSLLRHSLLINMPFMDEDKLSIKLLRQERDRVQNLFVKTFLTGSEQSVLLDIFSARLTQRT